MYEDHTIEEKYLHNFSLKEIKSFYRQHQKWEDEKEDSQDKLEELSFFDLPSILGNTDPKPASFLEIKYVLNRIAANDKRDTVFELGPTDKVLNADRLALDIAKAFQHNTVCKQIILNGIGLTDNGMLPVLRVLKNKQLKCLNIENNKLTGESARVLDDLLSTPGNKWEKVNLGKIKLTPEQVVALKKHPNLSFVPVMSSPVAHGIFRTLFQRS